VVSLVVGVIILSLHHQKGIDTVGSVNTMNNL